MVGTTTQLPDRTAGGVLEREEISCGGATVELHVGGSGPPLLLLHGIDGGLTWDDSVRRLADDFTVYLPSHPGFNGSSRPDWINTMADLAAWYNWLLEEIPRPDAVVGHSLGGWLAAEIAVRGGGIDRLVVVDAMGLEPPDDSPIADVFLMTRAEYAERAFLCSATRERYNAAFESDVAARWMLDRNLEMSSRIAWKPYMVDLALAGLLPRLSGRVGLIWGANDGVVPVACGHRYRDLIPNAELVVISDCGHHPHDEKPDEFVTAVKEFLL